MKIKTIILYILGAMFILNLPSYGNFGASIMAIILAALCFYFGYRSSKKNTKSSASETKTDKHTSNANTAASYSSSTNSIRTKVVGVTFKNDDGTDRQEILASVSPGDSLDLEPYEYNGAPAMKVIHALGCIGNLKAELAADLCDNPYITYTAEVLDVTGGNNGKSYGCNIEITEL